jgi:hypothetical protein
MAETTYPCCVHCADDVIHDVDLDDHTLPCPLCAPQASADRIEWYERRFARLRELVEVDPDRINRLPASYLRRRVLAIVNDTGWGKTP